MGTVVTIAPYPILSNLRSVSAYGCQKEATALLFCLRSSFSAHPGPAPPHCCHSGFSLAPYSTESRSLHLSNESRTKATISVARALMIISLILSSIPITSFTLHSF